MLELLATGSNLAQSNGFTKLQAAALSAMPQGVVISDARRPEIPIIYCNQGFEELTGYTLDEIKNRNCRFLQGPLTDPAAVEEIRAAIRGGRQCEIVLCNYRKDGSPFWNALTIAPIRNRKGEVTHFVGVQTDISAVKAMEQQLLQTQKMEALGQLAGSVAHDFNNLLTIIIGYSEILLDGGHSVETTVELLEQIQGAGKRAASLTRQLLSFSRKQAAQLQAVDLNSVVLGMENILNRLCQGTSQLSLVLEDSLPPVLGDSGHFEQMLLNLVVNARDAVEENGRVLISTRLTEVAEDAIGTISPGLYAVLSVEDNGCGMDWETQAKIFQPFFTTKAVGHGTGIGLATVQKLVEQAGGTIRVNSEPSVGTTFELLIPVAPALDEARLPALTASCRGPEILLFVDEDDEVREVSRRMLELHGYTVIGCATLQQAVTLIAEREAVPELLIVEQRAIEKDRSGSLEKLRSLRPLKLLLTTGAAQESVTIPAGIQDLLIKPFTSQSLATQVRRLLDA